MESGLSCCDIRKRIDIPRESQVVQNPHPELCIIEFVFTCEQGHEATDNNNGLRRIVSAPKLILRHTHWTLSAV